MRRRRSTYLFCKRSIDVGETAMRRTLGVALAASVATAGLATSARVGLAQARADHASAPTWVHNVGPLMAEACMGCHRPGEVAPMSLLTHEDARRWARSIRQVVRERIMPPWHADPRYGRFTNDRHLSSEQIRTIVEWAEAGAPRGEGEFTPPTFVEGWALGPELGPPDHVFRMEEEFRIPQDGPDLYPHIMAPANITEDMWVRAVEWRGNSRVVHHMSVRVLRPDGSRGGLGGIQPGRAPDFFPEGTARLLPAGSQLRFDAHYHPNGREESDRSEVGVWLARSPITHVMRTGLVNDVMLEIPPYDPNYESVAEKEFDIDGELLSLNAHMHYRGKDMMFEVIYPDGREEILLSVPNYDFNWQTTYELAERLRIPLTDGMKIRVTAHFDNSENNPRNPNPSLKVLYGRDSRDEMMEGWLRYRVKLDKPIIPSSAQLAGSSPVGTWNVKPEDVRQPIRGRETVILRVEQSDGDLRAQMTAVDGRLLDVDAFRFEGDTMFVEFGAYEYVLSLNGDRAAGTVISPFGELAIIGSRQDTGLLYVGEPQAFYTTRPGVIGHRTEFAPPEDAADPVAWVMQRVQSPEDLALIVTRFTGQAVAAVSSSGRLAIEFTNAAEFEEELLGYAGQRVQLKGTWRGDKIEIDTIELAPPDEQED